MVEILFHTNNLKFSLIHETNFSLSWETCNLQIAFRNSKVETGNYKWRNAEMKIKLASFTFKGDEFSMVNFLYAVDFLLQGKIKFSW